MTKSVNDKYNKIYIIINKNKEKSDKEIETTEYYGYTVEKSVKKYIENLIMKIQDFKMRDFKILLKDFIGIDSVYSYNNHSLKVKLIEWILHYSDNFKDDSVITLKTVKKCIQTNKDMFMIYNFIKLDDPFERELINKTDTIEYRGYEVCKDVKEYIENIFSQVSPDKIYDLNTRFNLGLPCFKDKSQIIDYIIRDILNLSSNDVVDCYKYKTITRIEAENVKRVIKSDDCMLTIFSDIDDFKDMLILENDFPERKIQESYCNPVYPTFINLINGIKFKN